MLDTTFIQVERIGPSKPSLHIAVVTETYPPDINGVAHTLSKIVNGLQARGHVMWLIRPRQQAADVAQSEERLQEVLVKGLPIPFYKQLRMGMPAKRELNKLWARNRPDIVHIATEGPLGWSALQAARKLKLPVSTDFRTNFHAYSQHYGVGWLRGAIMAYMKKFHNAAQSTMVPTEQLRQELAGLGFERLAVVPRGVDTELFHPDKRRPELRRSWGVDDGSLVVMCVGRLAAEKNLQVLVQAYQSMKFAHPRLKMVLVGDGPMRESLAQSCPDIHMAGFQTGLSLAEHYASADVFAFPSLSETFGNVTIEAMASGLPVLAFAHAAAGQLIEHNRNGLLVQPDQPHEFAQQLARLLADGPLRQQLAQAARETANGLEWQVIYQKTEAVFHQVVNHRFDRSTLMPQLGVSP